jgi:hypothetical protein
MIKRTQRWSFKDCGMSLRLTAPRIIAGLLAIGGIYWGVLLLPLIPHAENPLLPLLVFGPGYVVTLGYLIRVVTSPPLRGRQVIWGFSVLVQGGWLVCHVVATLGNGGPISRLTEPHLIMAWWVFATVGSIVAFMMEREAA